MKLKDGLLILDKEAGISSFQAIARLRRALGIRRIGHCGTLDPFASGTLPVAFGRWTSALYFMEAYRKRYAFRAKLGERRDTQDPEGELTASFPKEEILNMLASGELQQRLDGLRPEMEGRIRQLPPMYSAIKIEGKPLYKYAREGKELERREREVEVRIERLTLRQEDSTVWLEGSLDVSKGTYIRSWVDALGEKLGVYACCEELCRLACGPFELQNGISSGRVLEIFDAGGRDSGKVLEWLYDAGFLLPLRHAWPELPLLSLGDEETRAIIDGKALPFSEKLALCIRGKAPREGERLYLETAAGRPLAMARLKSDENACLRIKSERVWLQHGDFS